MARKRKLPPAQESDPDTISARSKIATSRGVVTPLYESLLHSPPVAIGWESLLTAVRRKSVLSADLREIIILRIATLNNAPYEFNAHIEEAIRAGLEETQIDALKSLNLKSECFSNIQLLTIEFCDALTRRAQIDDQLYQKVSLQSTPRELVELTVTVSAYNMVSRFLAVFHVE